MSKKQLEKLIDYLRGIEEDVSQCSNETKASDKAYGRIVKNAKTASRLLESLLTDWN